MNRTSTRLLACGTAMVVSSGLLVTIPADASPSSWARGQVTTTSLTGRTAPHSRASAIGSVRKGQRIDIICKVHGQRVAGNDLWYRVPDEETVFLSARYVRNIGPAPRWCSGNSVKVRAQAALPVREAPLTAARQVRTIRKGSTFTAVCSISSQQRNSPAWYYLTDGRWVSSKHVVQSMPTQPCY